MASAIVEATLAATALSAQMMSLRMKIAEAKGDYSREIGRLNEQKFAREAVMESQLARARSLGSATLEETAKQSQYETRQAFLEAEQVASGTEAQMGASGLQATGSARAIAQQKTDIAYAGAQRIAEGGAQAVTLGGMKLGDVLKTGQEQKSLLSMEYRQNIAEQRYKLAELSSTAPYYLRYALMGGIAGIVGGFYRNVSESVGKAAKLFGA